MNLWAQTLFSEQEDMKTKKSAFSTLALEFFCPIQQYQKSVQAKHIPQ
jgi:hypothetical protein